MEKIKNIRLRTDNSEIIPYTIESIPIYAVREQQSNYPKMCGIMHWHDDIEFIRIVSGRMNYLVNDNVIELNEEDIIFVNSQQIHGHRHINYEECIFDGILVPTNVLVYPKQLAEKYVNPFFYDSKFSSFVFRKGDRGHDELTNTFNTMMSRHPTAVSGRAARPEAHPHGRDDHRSAGRTQAPGLASGFPPPQGVRGQGRNPAGAGRIPRRRRLVPRERAADNARARRTHGMHARMPQAAPARNRSAPDRTP